MTYPEPVYLGDDGEVSATYRSATAKPEITFESGATLSYIATGASTGGKFGIYRMDMGPQHGGATPHFHRGFTESFFVVAGTVGIYDGKDWLDAAPGDFIHVPEGGLHGFRNTSGAPASLLIHFSPGAPREPYFEGLLRLGDMSDEERAAFFIEHDNIWV